MKPGRRILASITTPLVFLVLVSCARKVSKVMLEPSQALIAVLAGETVQVAGANKTIILILPQWAANSTAVKSFKAALKKQGVTVAFSMLANVGSPMGRNGIGLKSADFFKALQKDGSAGAIVSLAGVPVLNAQDVARLDPNHPPVLVVATRSLGYSPLGNVLGVPVDRNYLISLLNAKVVQFAIVDGKSEPNTKPPARMGATQKLFFQHYTILRSHH